MQRDPVFESYLRSAAGDAAEINQRSCTARLVPDPRGGKPSDRYHCVFEGLAYLRRGPGGHVAESRDPISWRLSFPEDYLRPADPGIAYRVVSLGSRVWHPNVYRRHVCIAGFGVGMRLRSIVEQVYAILSVRAFSTRDPLNPVAARYFEDNAEQIAALHSPPLYLQPIARVSHVRTGEVVP